MSRRRSGGKGNKRNRRRNQNQDEGVAVPNDNPVDLNLLDFTNDRYYDLEFFSMKKEILELHVETTVKASRNIFEEIQCEINIAYGEREREKIDIIGTDLGNEAPFLVFIHGGLWLQKPIDRRNYAYIAEGFHKHGVKVAVIGYELCPDIPFGYMITAMEKAAKKCIEIAQKLGSRGLHFVGHCSGAHLLACLFTNFIKTLTVPEQELIKDAVLICGIYNLHNVQRTGLNDILGLEPETATQYSPVMQTLHDGQGTKFHVVCATIGSPEFSQQALRFHEKLRNSKFYSKFLDISYRGHTDHFEMITDWNNEAFPLYKYVLKLVRYLP